jgi:hypothetical protein
MEGGRISEQGSYASLLSSGAAFSRLIAEFGSANNKSDKANKGAGEGEGEDEIIEEVVAGGKEAKKAEEAGKESEKTVGGTKYGEKGADGAKLMQSEERETGSVSGKVYTHYFQVSSSRSIYHEDCNSSTLFPLPFRFSLVYGKRALGSCSPEHLRSRSDRYRRQQHLPRLLEVRSPLASLSYART